MLNIRSVEREHTRVSSAIQDKWQLLKKLIEMDVNVVPIK